MKSMPVDSFNSNSGEVSGLLSQEYREKNTNEKRMNLTLILKAKKGHFFKWPLKLDEKLN
jgi:hypothetical protein